jgi:hypothetical protein
MEKNTGLSIRHAYNHSKGEKVINCRDEKGFPHKYELDGWDKNTKTAYEFYGCYWHGCTKCEPHRNKLGRKKENGSPLTMNGLYARTKARERHLLKSGVVNKIVSIWGCEWDVLKKKSSALHSVIEEKLLSDETLKPRDSLFGGRTNALSLFWKQSTEDEYLSYIDICSLYPSVQFFDPYPHGHHTVLKEVILQHTRVYSIKNGLVSPR